MGAGLKYVNVVKVGAISLRKKEGIHRALGHCRRRHPEGVWWVLSQPLIQASCHVSVILHPATLCTKEQPRVFQSICFVYKSRYLSFLVYLFM